MGKTELEKRLKDFAKEIRAKDLECIASIGTGHVGGTLSIADLMAVLYEEILNIDPKNPKWPERDKLVISKGHAGPCAYATLALKGYFPLEELHTLNRNGTRLPSHTDRNLTPGIDMTTGSLGQGASTAVGLALCDKLDNRSSHTYCILGDGECNEGQVWEAVLFACHHKLDNLVFIVDYNHLQCDGTTEDVCDLGDLAEKFRVFGCHSINVEDGNDVMQIYDALCKAKTAKNAPAAVILNTVKGKGIKKFENRYDYHHCKLDAALFAECLEEIYS